MQRVLVTGGAGFLGSHLCERLIADGHHVLCLDNFYTGRLENVAHLCGPRFDLIQHDLVDPFYVEVDAVYHLACPASPVHYQRNAVRTLRTAFEGTYNALALARDTGARILIASTSEVYGDPQTHPQPESYWGHVNPVGTRSCYDEGKRAGEALAVAFAKQHRVEVRIARIFNTYGPRMHEQDGRVVSNFMVQALQREPLTIYGDGRQTRSFCFVSDLIEAFVRLMACSTNPGPINLGNPEELTINTLAQTIAELANIGADALKYLPLPKDDPQRRRPDITQARSILGWTPRVPVRDGLRQTYDYFRERFAASSIPRKSSLTALPTPTPRTAWGG